MNIGNVYFFLRKYDQALNSYDKSIKIDPKCEGIWTNRGNSLFELGRHEEALVDHEKEIALHPNLAQAWFNKGNVLKSLKRHDLAAQCFQRGIELNIGDSYFLGELHHQRMFCCDWRNYEEITNEIFHKIANGRKSAEPFGFQGISTSEELLNKCAEIYSKDKFPAQGNLAGNSRSEHNKIRIGYLCGEFRYHATSILMAGIWESYDTSKFEIFAFDNGWDDNSEYRQRINLAFTNIYDISSLSDQEAAQLVHSHEIDILVNLNGFFGLFRQGIFSYKPAPIQVNYLGFPGTLGASYYDYIIADKFVLPSASRKHYFEKIIYLPNTYQANDDQRKISNRKFSRAQFGIPDNSFVFACFNNSYKITPSTFDLWMRILKKVDDSILWILADNTLAQENLIKEATSRGVDSSRLVFADRLELSEHLARQKLADLFLDTSPYNAHTTCSDALWAGLPVITLMGSTFPGRVSASLLNAVGLGELVTFSSEEYESLAIDLAKNPEKLGALKEKLEKNRLSTPLFNTSLFSKGIEAAYSEIYKRHQSDLAPEDIFID
jgi:predicted O-linked N-acetylglucosamine transferase (SPINDLY family)